MNNLYELAQVNIALLREPIDSELLKDFVSELDPVNAEADSAAGSIWQLQTDEGDGHFLRAHGPTPIAFTIKHRFSPPTARPSPINNDLALSSPNTFTYRLRTRSK